MARPKKELTIQQMQQQPVVKKQNFELHPTTLKHIFALDINDDGNFREVAVVKKWQNGSVTYIDVALLDNIDKGRIKGLVMSTHADKYELWDLMYQNRLSNGVNALEYFNQLVKHKMAPGSNTSMLAGSLSSVRADTSSKMIGADFSDPSSGTLGG